MVGALPVFHLPEHGFDRGPVAVEGAAPAQANVAAVMGEDAVLGAAVADAGYWSEANAASQTEECELFIATQKDRKQRAALREAPAPRGRMPRSMTARERMDRKLRTKRGECGTYPPPMDRRPRKCQERGRIELSHRSARYG